MLPTAWTDLGNGESFANGLPARRRDLQRQKVRKPARCQRITVSGSTMASASRMRGASRYRQTKNRRSKLLKTARFGDRRRSTLSWWRKARFSASSKALVRNSPRSIHLSRLAGPACALHGPIRSSGPSGSDSAHRERPKERSFERAGGGCVGLAH